MNKISLNFYLTALGAIIIIIFYFANIPKEMAVILMGLILSLVTIKLIGAKRIIPSVLLITTLLFSFSHLISAVANGFTYQSIIETVASLLCLCALAIGSLYSQHSIYSIRLIKFFVVLSFILSLTGLTEMANRPLDFSQAGMLIPFGNPAFSLSFFLLCLPFCHFAFITSMKKIERLFFFSASVLCLSATISNNAFPLWFTVLLSTLYILGSALILSEKYKIQAYLSAFLIFCASLVISVNILGSYGRSPLPLAIFQEINRWAFSDRGVRLKDLHLAIQKNPLFGIGPDNLEDFSKIYQDLPYKWGAYSENYLAQSLTERGIIGFILVLFIFSTVLYASIKQIIKTKIIYKRIVLLSLSGLILFNFFSPSLSIFPFILIFFLFIPFAFPYLMAKHITGIKNALMPAVFIICLILLADNLLLHAGKYFAVKNNNAEAKKILKIPVLVNLPFNNPKTQHWLASVYFQEEKYTLVLETLKNLEKRKGYFWDLIFLKSLAFYRTGDLKKAENILKEEINRHKYARPEYYDTLAGLYLQSNNSLNALAIINEAKKAYPNPYGSLNKLQIGSLNISGYLNPVDKIYYKEESFKEKPSDG